MSVSIAAIRHAATPRPCNHAGSPASTGALERVSNDDTAIATPAARALAIAAREGEASPLELLSFRERHRAHPEGVFSLWS